MKSLVEFIQEAIRPTKGGTIMFDVKKGKVKVDDFINALSEAHNAWPTNNVMIACDDYEDYEKFTLELVDPMVAINANRNSDHGPKKKEMVEREAKVLEMLIEEGYFN